MDEEEEIKERRRGRPKGSLNKASSLGNWQPKKWKPLYDWVIVRHLVGETNKEIAEQCDLHEAHVGNIIRSLRGQEEIAKIRGKGSFHKTVEAKLEHIKQKSIDRMVQFIDNDTAFEKNPIAATDRAINIAEKLGSIGKNAKEEGNKVINNHVMILNNPQVQDELTKALAFSATVRQLHSGEPAAEPVDIGLEELEQIEVPVIPQLQR